MLVISALGIAVGVVTLDVAHDVPGYGFAGASSLAGAALLAAGWALIACGLAAWLRRPDSGFGILLAGAGLAWFAAEWDSPGVGSSLAFTAGLCLSAACPVLVGHAVLAYPGGRLASRIERVVVLVSYACALGFGVLSTAFYDPQAQACSACPSNLLVVADRETLSDDLARAGIYAGTAWAAALTCLVVRGLPRPATRQVTAPGTAYLVLVAAAFIVSLGSTYVSNGPWQRRLWYGQALALLALAGGVAWGWVRAHRARSDMARLVVELAQSPPPGGLRDLLAVIVGDPGLVLAYPLDSGRLVDAHGLTVDVPLGHQQTRVVLDGRTVAVLGHAPGALRDEQLVAEVTAAARLALENERLQAEVRSRLEDLRASRARIVAAGDAERKRLERDLHDGAQQRLVALSLSLRLARLKVPESAELERAEQELASAIEELRELAHGIFPAVLADDGLSAAVHALVEEAPTPVRIGELPERRFDSSLESAAYAVVAETVRAASGSVLVSASANDGVLAVELAAPGVNGLDVVALEDRLGALDGRLDVLQAAGVTTIHAELPCES